MAIKFSEIYEAFDFISFGPIDENRALLHQQFGKIYYISDYPDELETLPAHIDEQDCIDIPHKAELGLGRRLALDFTDRYLPDDYERVREMFRKKGAYARFKDLLERKELLEQWYQFESDESQKALREWCEECEIAIED